MRTERSSEVMKEKNEERREDCVVRMRRDTEMGIREERGRERENKKQTDILIARRAIPMG